MAPFPGSTSPSCEPTEFCTDCGSEFENVQMLKHYLIRAHSKSIACDECGEMFANADKFRLHVGHHLKAVTHTCSECGKEFRKESKLRVSYSNVDRLIRRFWPIAYYQFRNMRHCTLANSFTTAMCARNLSADIRNTWRTAGRTIRAPITIRHPISFANIAIPGPWATLQDRWTDIHANVMSLQIPNKVRTWKSFASL